VDQPEPDHERPRTMRKRARMLMHQAARLGYDAGDVPREETIVEMKRLQDEAIALNHQIELIQAKWERAASRPATWRTAAASGAQEGEPMQHFPRALRRMLVGLGVPPQWADRLVDTQSGATWAGTSWACHWKGRDWNRWA